MMKTVAPDLQTTLHDMGCIPHRARTVRVAPVMIRRIRIRPINLAIKTN